MKKTLLTSFFFLLITAVSLEARETLFLLLDPNGGTPAVQASLEAQGVRVLQAFPPAILVVEIPDGFNISTEPRIKTVFPGRVSPESVKDLGPMGRAAAMEWNKRVRQDKRKSGMAMMSDNNIFDVEAPSHVRLAPTSAGVNVQWDALPGVALYEVRWSQKANTPLTNTTRCKETTVTIPMESASEAPAVLVQVRAVDRPDALDATKDAEGPWSTLATLLLDAKTSDKSAATPTPTSPWNGYEAIGFTVILEWTTEGKRPVRVQVSNTRSFAAPLIDLVTMENEYIVPSGALHVGDTLQWRVAAWGDNQSEWSSPSTIRIRAPRPIESDMMVNPEAPR